MDQLIIFTIIIIQYDEVFISTKIPLKTQKEIIDFCDRNLISVKLLPELVNYEFKNFFIKII